jgi:predicted short-subunit dehydrogenase-like oxidoreductase (DUF2520 family)
MSRRPRPTPTVIVGTGRLARSLAPQLDRVGHPVRAVVGRRRSAVLAACHGLRVARATTSLESGVELGRLVLLAVADRDVAALASRLAELGTIDWRHRVVLHHAGALGLEALDPLRRAGAAVGLLHPLQCLGGDPRRAAAILPGSRALVAGDARGLRAARRLARALGLVILPFARLTSAERTTYHAAAAMASNDMLALVAIAAGLLEALGLGPRAALAALLPLLRGTLAQAEAHGLVRALTGPAARGDVPTLAAHLRRLARDRPEHGEIHRLLSLELARLAVAGGDGRAAATLARFGGPKRRQTV